MGSDEVERARAGRVLHAERLWLPWSWIAVMLVLVATLGLAYGVAGGRAWAGPPVLIGLALVAWAVAGTATPVRVDEAGLHAGRALLTPDAIGAVRALDPAAARALRGPDADPAAYLVLRGWVATAVRVDVADPEDPHPYWFVSTRHPARLAAAVERVRGAQRA